MKNTTMKRNTSPLMAFSSDLFLLPTWTDATTSTVVIVTGTYLLGLFLVAIQGYKRSAVGKALVLLVRVTPAITLVAFAAWLSAIRFEPWFFLMHEGLVQLGGGSFGFFVVVPIVVIGIGVPIILLLYAVLMAWKIFEQLVLINFPHTLLLLSLPIVGLIAALRLLATIMTLPFIAGRAVFFFFTQPQTLQNLRRVTTEEKVRADDVAKVAQGLKTELEDAYEKQKATSVLQSHAYNFKKAAEHYRRYGSFFSKRRAEAYRDYNTAVKDVSDELTKDIERRYRADHEAHHGKKQ